MAHRLEKGGRLIDRSQPLGFRFNGRDLEGFEGDTLASALLANDRVLVGRSFKYHRPRGIVASGAEEPNALFGVGAGNRFEPNQRATTTELHAGMEAISQNHWPSLDFDIGAVNAAVASMLPVFSAGFYYKTFMYPRAAWKHVYEPFIRRAAGLGKAPSERDPDSYEHLHAHTDVLVIGGGIAGLAAAREAAASGARVLLVEQTAHWGGRALAEAETRIDGVPAADWATARAAELEADPSVVTRLRTMAAGLYDHGYALLYERVSDHRPGTPGAPRHRLWRVRAKQIVVATGAIERPLTFAGNDTPGVMLAGAVRDYIRLYGVCPGRRAIVYANNDDAYRTALALHEAGAEVVGIVDVRHDAEGALPEMARALQIPIHEGRGIARARGGKRLEGVEIGRLKSGTEIGGAGPAETVDLVAMSGGWSPVVHLYSHCGGKLAWDDTALMFRPHPEAGAPLGPDGEINTRCAGAANGELTSAPCLADARMAGRAAAEAAGFTPGPELPVPAVEEPAEQPVAAHWFTPSRDKYAHGTKHFVDFQNDVTAADVRLAAREGYESVEHTKRYTTLGMATDQGKTSNINGLALLAEALGAPIQKVGTTTFRPPYTPISMGAIAGQAAGPLFKAVRQTPMHGWHAANGADFEPVGDWERPYCYRREGESREAAVRREVLNARGHVGLLDASTLGKIAVKGPDAGVFLDRIYTNMMSTLKPGRCRYGLMCNENGFLFDDGVVVRTGADSFLLHTTSGGSDRVAGHLEEWLQTEWWDLEVYVQNVTDHWAQIAVAGPEARRLIEAAGTDADISADALPFMAFAEGTVAGCPARIFRISFSGELSYEIATPAGHGLALWQALHAAGEAFGAMPYGTEALHVMRAEKGFIMIGDETDGTVTPQDLGLHWAVSKKKDDFLGKRAQSRADLIRPNRKQLVGLSTEDPAEVLPDGAHAVEDIDAPKPMRTIGHVTSSYFSPTLDRSIAMALIERGSERMGETLLFPVGEDKVIRAEVVSPVFYDAAGERQNV
ncbi:sarcosine oxidase subunit alpha family protein [Paralimibaculum aggregatum]|uniref:Sarcosine oxidase subunit alpha family protein n=1 Tax=Paralimibaculum aggregatum TaxID=3036245 RepID=A0ABQ6LFJ5_9RHOB|nr:sarcosine oxidase subunit alpha family protein [Limibaculum sp. NKW23]GMG80799.1 sarcosine oxidase subunit alpha family protein [Limibaculum sp. NKW23]